MFALSETECPIKWPNRSTRAMHSRKDLGPCESRPLWSSLHMWCLTGEFYRWHFRGKTERHMVNGSDWLGTVVDCEAVEVFLHHDNGINSPRNPSKTDLVHQTLSPPQHSTISTISLIISNFYISQNHFYLLSRCSSLRSSPSLLLLLLVSLLFLVTHHQHHQPGQPPSFNRYFIDASYFATQF